MANKISIDSFSSRPLHDSINHIPMGNAQPFNNLQNIMQMKIMSTIHNNLGVLTTGNDMIDMIIITLMQCILIGLITGFVTKISNIPTYIYLIYYYIQKRVSEASFFVYYKLLRKQNIKMIKRNVDIPYISDTRQINELYKAVFWYLTHDEKIDYNKELYLQFVYSHKLTQENKDLIFNDTNIHKILSQNKTKNIKYKNYEITYWLTTENITVHTDKDRTRENYKVQLSTIVPESLDNDILEDFCKHCLLEYVKSLTSSIWKQQIYTNNGNEWKSTPSNNIRKLDTIILKKGLKDEIKTDLDLFLNSEEWYSDRDIPYTRGYLLYGYPGTGKTSIIKGISTYSKRHIHYLILSNIKSDAELIELLKKINYKETILVIEDIDATLDIVKSREVEDKDNKEEKEKEKEKDKEKDKEKEKDNKEKSQSQLTLSGLLNAIDGVFSTYGRILIMTTNHPEVLDEALIRPGRIDCKYLFDNCDREQIRDLFKMFFNQLPNQDLLNEIKNNKYSPAHITSVFLRYRNNPNESLMHLDDDCTKVFLPPREIYDKPTVVKPVAQPASKPASQSSNSEDDNKNVNNIPIYGMSELPPHNFPPMSEIPVMSPIRPSYEMLGLPSPQFTSMSESSQDITNSIGGTIRRGGLMELANMPQFYVDSFPITETPPFNNDRSVSNRR